MGIQLKASPSKDGSSKDFEFMPATIAHIDQYRAPQGSARGLTLLAHAIERLSEQYVFLDGADEVAVQRAIQLLMQLRATLYSESSAVRNEARLPFWSRVLAG